MRGQKLLEYRLHLAQLALSDANAFKLVERWKHRLVCVDYITCVREACTPPAERNMKGREVVGEGARGVSERDGVGWVVCA